MDLETARACITNALLIALADRQFHPLQRQLLQRFVAEAGVPVETARTWADAVRNGAIDFLPVREPEQAVVVLKLALGVAAADGALAPEERSALRALGKATGVGRQQLEQLLREVWGKDVIVDLFPPLSPLSAGTVLVSDDFKRLQPMLDASKDVALDVRTLDEVRPTQAARAVVFHAAEERDATLAKLEQIKRLSPDAVWIAVIDRHQAPQVSYLLDAGVFRCLVEDVYPGELRALLDEALARGKP